MAIIKTPNELTEISTLGGNELISMWDADEVAAEKMKKMSPLNFAAQIQEFASFGGFKNLLINGNFDIWQRGTSQTSIGYGSDDRYRNDHSGSSKTHSQQSFTIGQTDVPNNPRYFSRTVVSSVAGASNYVNKQHRIESVTTLSGQTATLSFWAKADTTRTLSIEFIQNFGTGGSPSSEVKAIGVEKITISTVWQKFTHSASIPSISGKTLGTAEDHFLKLNFWFDAGSDNNYRTDSLGHQSGTFDIAQVQLEKGSIATPFEQRPVGIELGLCQRYYYKSGDLTCSTSGTNMPTMLFQFPITMGYSPTLTVVNGGGSGTVSASYNTTTGFRYNYDQTTGARDWNIEADAEL